MIFHEGIVGNPSGTGFPGLPANSMVLGSSGGGLLVQAGKVGVVVLGDSWAVNFNSESRSSSSHST